MEDNEKRKERKHEGQGKANEKERNGEASAEDTPMDKKGCMIKVGGYGMSE